MANSQRILIVRTDRIGDVVLSTPVIRSLREAFPDAHLAMMVRPGNRELVEGHPDLDAVILYDKQGREKGWLGNFRFAAALRAHRFDTALILHSTNRVILVTWLAGIRRRVGYARRLPWGLTHRLPYVKREGDRHELEYNLDLVRLIGVEGKRRDLFVPTPPAQEARVAAFLQGQGIDGASPLIVLHPGASCPSKRWPAERFAEVGDALSSRHGARVVVVTGPEDPSAGRQVLGRMRVQATPALGTLGLGELACLLRRARCLISNDSGPVHLACAVGTPVVAIFGRWGGGLSPTRWGPTGPRGVALHHDVGCRPCLAHRCPIGFVCLQAVAVDEVVAAAEWAGRLESG